MEYHYIYTNTLSTFTYEIFFFHSRYPREANFPSKWKQTKDLEYILIQISSTKAIFGTAAKKWFVILPLVALYRLQKGSKGDKNW